MESERFSSSRASLGFPPDRRAAAETAAQRQTPTILERFRAMIRGREEDHAAGSDGEDEPSPPTAGEIVGFYEELLSELTYNSKPIITDLTVIAGEQREHAEGIVDAICVRILEAPVDQKLPSLYLLDSIVKNIGREYIRYFAARLPKVFCEAYNQVHSSLRPAMRHLFGTWSHVFPLSLLCKIEDGLQRGTPGNQRSTSLEDTRPSESPSPRPSHGIHVNPKYLEARRRFEHPASDVQHVSGVSSSLQDYGQKSSNQYGDYDFEHAEALPPRIAMTRAGSPLAAARSSSMMGGEGPFPRSKSRGSRPSSPPRIGMRSISPAGDRFQGDVSPGRVFERNSPSHSGVTFGNGRVSDQNGWLERRRLSDDAAQQRDGPTGFNLKNGYGKQHSRELIDAYGNYRGKDAINEKHSKIQRLDVNDMNSEAFTRKWQNSEEEEYVWENMSPTLSDRSRNIVPPFGCYNERVHLKGPDDRVLEPDFRRNGHLDHGPLPRVDDPLTIFDDRNPVPGSGHRPMSKQYLDGKGSQNEPLLHFKGAHHMQELGKLPYSFPHYSQQGLSPKSRGRVLPMPSSVASIDQNLPAPYDNFSDGEVPFLGLPGVRSDTLNVDTLAYKKNLLQRPYSPHIASGLWPPVHNSQPLPPAPIPPNYKPIKSSFEFLEGNRPILNKVPTSSLFLPMPKYDAADRKIMDPNKLYQLPYQHSDLLHVNQQRQEVGTVGIHSKEAHGSFIPPAPTHFSPFVPQPINHPRTQGEGALTGSAFSNSLSNRPVSVGNRTVADTFSHAHSGSVPPLPPGPPPPSSQMGPSSQNIGSIVSSSPAATFSGLISNLMAQGLISLKPPDQSQDSVGVEFNVELLKVRHESIINALYADLPRQCTTCGLRFKCQEEHSSHMDWHVTKNRISKNRKQKSSRKWFVNVKEWLSGAETVGTDASPGFLPSEAVTEKKEDNEMAVPADEDQNACALCAEPFEDFYSDETEEWMYKGAVYMNAPAGKIDGLDRSQLGPIVHAKCRSQTAEDIGQA